MTIGVGNNGVTNGGSVSVVTTENTGLSVEYWAERCLDRIIFVGEDKLYPSPIRDQALAYKDEIRQALIHYITQAIKSDRTTLHGLLNEQGEIKMAEIIRRL